MTIKLTELSAYLLNANGQHIGSSLANLRLDYTKLYYALKPDIENFSDYFPITKKFNISDNDNTSGAVIDFTSHFENIGYDLSVPQTPVFGNPPEKILKCTPVGSQQIMNNWQSWTSMRTIPGQLGHIPNPILVKREYRKPKLYVTMGGKFDVTASYRPFHKITGTINAITDVDFIGLDNHRLLYDLLSGRFLQMVGRSRRAFTHTNLPITTDAETLVTEGVALYEKTWQAIYDQHPWYKAYNH